MKDILPKIPGAILGAMSNPYAAAAAAIYRHSGPSSPRLGGGGLSKLITNSYCSYVT